MTTAVPPIQFTPAGLVLPTDAEILTGVQADYNTAFGGGVNPALETPQGQLASSEAAVISDKNAEVAIIVNQVDPQYSNGRFQDGIARIYFLNRKGATATVVTCTLGGAPGTVIPAGTLAQDTSGNTYASSGDATIGGGSTVDQDFQNIITGPIACPAGTLSKVVQGISGWDTITNATDGAIGHDVENRTDFELRRANSVALNAHGTPESIYAVVFEVDDVLDVYVIDNPYGVPTFTGVRAGMTLTVSGALTDNELTIGSIITGAGVTAATYVRAFGTGTGGNGTYTVSTTQTLGSVAMSSPGVVKGATDFPLAPHSVYVAVVGGTDADVAQAMWSKKDLGCNYNGNTTETVTDPSGYSYPLPTYTVTFERPAALPILFAVQLQNNGLLPSGYVATVKAAIIARFNGTDGTVRQRIAATVIASVYYAPVAAVGPNVVPLSIQVGTVTANLAQVPVGIDQRPTITASDITITLV